MSAMKVFLVAAALMGFVSIGCRKFPYEDLMNAPQAVEIDGRTFTLDGAACRVFMPVNYDSTGSSLGVGIALTGSDTTKPFPFTLRADRVWVLKSQYEVWGAILRSPADTWPRYRILYQATGGPEWPTDIWVSVAARLRNADGRTWLLRDPEVYIGRAE